MAFKDAKITRHPSFGVISMSKAVSSGKQPLFGSSLEQNHFLQMKIHHAVLHRDLSRDWIMSEGIPLISILLSPTQFADAITSLNTAGTPCTIEFFAGEHVEKSPFESKRIQFDAEFEKKMRDTASEQNEFISKINTILDKPNITKKDKAEILSQLRSLKMQIESNIPHIKRQFTEQMDETVIEAKNEVAHYINQQLTSLGLEKFKDKFALEFLPEDIKDEPKDTKD